MILKLLVWIGLTRKKRNGKWFVPFHTPPKWMLPRNLTALKSYIGWHHNGLPYFFRNKSCNPRFHTEDWNPRRYKRLLPFRWGFGWLGFEFGDRGGEHIP